MLSKFVNTGVIIESSSVEIEEKMRYIENQKQKFAASKGLTMDGSEIQNKIPYLDDDDDDAGVEVVDEIINTNPLDKLHETTMITDDINAFCGSCMWNNTNFNCDARVDFIMKRYPKENPTRDGTIQFIMKAGHCVDPKWAPKFIDEEIADVESKAASILRKRGEGDNFSGTTPDISTSSLLLHNSPIKDNTITQQTLPPPQPPSPSLIPIKSNSTTSTAIDIVSLTTNEDFFILFNNSAITSWLRHIQNIRSITFIGPPHDYNLFQQNMVIHYPHLVDDTNNNRRGGILIPIRWIDETHWITNYKNKHRVPYPQVFQQLIKLFVFDLRTKLNVDIGNNVLIVDSDTVWSRDVTFVHDNGTVTYFEVYDYANQDVDCFGIDPIDFTEAITMGPPSVNMLRSNHSTGERTRSDTIQFDTVTPYSACRREKYPNATGARHIAHHMLFQYDVMMHLHSTINKAWSLPNIWAAFMKCSRFEFCKSRVAEYELYFSFISFNYPDRVYLEQLVNGVNYMAGSAICTNDEMECCREKSVLLKGCHNHRIDALKEAKGRFQRKHAIGEMCC